MKSLSIKWLVWLGFCAVIAVCAIVFVIALFLLSRISAESNEIISSILPPLRQINAIQYKVGKNHGLLLQHINVGTPSQPLTPEEMDETRKVKGALENNSAEIEDDIVKFRSFSDAREEKEALGQAVKAQSAYKDLRSQILVLSEGRKTTEALAMFREKLEPAYETYVKTIKDLVDSQELQAEAMGKTISADVSTTYAFVVAGLLTAIAISAAIAWYTSASISRPMQRLVAAMDRVRTGDFTQPVEVVDGNEFGRIGSGINAMIRDLGALVAQVQRSGIQVKTSVTEISATAKEHQATSTEIATTTSEITATAREISNTSQTLRSAADRVSSVSDEAASLATEGQKGLTRMDESMKQIMEASTNITNKLDMINEKAGNINKVVGTITKLAEQTNLLSLNAAIEAERAGEFGQGFSVVATEIRRLADKTADATYDIEQIIKEMVAAVSAGVMSMDKFGEEVRRGAREVETIGGQLESVIHQVRSLVPEIRDLKEGVHSQAASSVEITEALTQLGEAASQTSESLRQANSAIEQLNEAARGLYTGISRFRVRAVAPGSGIPQVPAGSGAAGDAGMAPGAGVGEPDFV
ncbi:methyl-accepting chemotaxis protein [Verrucomicrobia bacterium LW23]|nr:methyl-accepting chemotaxis protein [Verrucomicrobia bacterium LW23]